MEILIHLFLNFKTIYHLLMITISHIGGVMVKRSRTFGHTVFICGIIYLHHSTVEFLN